MIDNQIILKIGNVSTRVEGRLDSEIYQKFKRELGYRPENVFWMVKNSTEKSESNNGHGNEKWKHEWDGVISTVCWNKQHCRCNNPKNGMHFPTGLLSKAVDFFKNNNIKFLRTDCRIKTLKTSTYMMSEEFEFRQYQNDIIRNVVGDGSSNNGIDRGIIKCATGGGKTSIACGILAGIGVTPSIYYVPSIDLLEQAKREIEKFIKYKDGRDLEVGIIGGGEKVIKDISVMTIQTAVKALGGVWVKYDDEDTFHDELSEEEDSATREEIKDLIKNSKLMICDEVQHWAAETCQIISDNSINCQYRFGMSATPYRDKGDDILIESCFGRTIADINASYLIRHGFLVKPIIYFAKINNVKDIKHSSYQNIYKSAIIENEFRNDKILKLSEKFKEAGRKILILVKQINHGKILEKLIPDSVFLYGDTPKKKRLKHLDRMRAGDPVVTIASVIFDEGIDCRPLDTLILAGSGKSSTRALQRIGRILRPHDNKKDAIAIDFLDHCKYMQAHSRKRLSIYKTEEEFDLVYI